MFPASGFSRRKVALRLDGGPHDPQAVGADDPHPVGLVDPEDLLLQASSLFARFPETGGDDDEPFHTGPAAGVDDPRNGGGGGRDDGQIDRSGHGADVGPAGASQDRLPIRIDRIDRSVARGQRVFQDGPSERPLLLRCADDGDRRRIEELLQITHAISLLWIRALHLRIRQKAPAGYGIYRKQFYFNLWDRGLQSLFRVGPPIGKISRETVSDPCYKDRPRDLFQRAAAGVAVV